MSTTQLIRRFLVLIAMTSALVACVSSKQIDATMASWMGYHSSDLIAKWGPPNQILDDGTGGKIFVYTSVRTSRNATATTIYSDYALPTATTTYREPQHYEAHRMFWANKQGRLYRWAWKGR